MTYMVEKTIAFCEIDDIDLYGVSKFASILHTEVKPLQISISIWVVPHPDIESRCIFHPHLV